MDSRDKKMQRSPILQPLSREHHRALKLAKLCERAAAAGDSAQIDRACAETLQVFESELERHFQSEEYELLPKLPMGAGLVLAQRTLAEHEQLRSLRSGLKARDVNALAEFAHLLYAHVRFEERELFPFIEAELAT